MDGFLAWALDPARTNDEKYTVELIVEEAVARWHARHQTGVEEDLAAREERNRQRQLNPAYIASYSEEDLRRAVEILADCRQWSHFPYAERPLRDLKAFGFLDLESLDLSWCEAADLGPIAKIPNLRSFNFRSCECSDFRPLGGCKNLRTLHLSFSVPWPEVSGLENLVELEELSLSGNLLAFAPGVSWPGVRRGTLMCSPLAARSCKDLPLLPGCIYLTLGGVDRLEGIEQMPALRNLVLNGPVQDFAPLQELKELTCLSITGDKPKEIASLKHLPRLQFVQFGELYKPNKPRDYSPLAEAPMLRELVVLGCPPVEMEVTAINAGLLHWEDLVFEEEPRSLAALRMIVAPAERHPQNEEQTAGEEIADEGLLSCEARCIANHLHGALERLTGLAHWGVVRVHGIDRSFLIELHAIETIEMFPEVIGTIRATLARLRREYSGTLMITLRKPPVIPTAAEIVEQERQQEMENNACYEQWLRDQEEYMDRLHRYELKKEEGSPIDPAEFSVPDGAQFWAEDPGEFDASALDEAEASEGCFFEENHPMAAHYRLQAHLDLESIWFYPQNRSLAVHLMGRGPDQEL